MFKLLALLSVLFVGPQHETYTKVYNIQDLECHIPEFDISTRLMLDSALRHQPAIISTERGEVKKEAFDNKAFIEIIKYAVDPNDDGPTDIRYWRGCLIVKTTKEIHNRIK